MVRMELVAHSPCPPASAKCLQAMPRRVSGAHVLPLRGRVEATSEPSCITPVHQAPSTGFAHLQRSCHSRVLPRRAVVPTVASSARLLQGRGLLARATHALRLFWPRCRRSFLCCWSGVGLFCSAHLSIYRRHRCMWSWITCPRSCLSLARARVALRCQCEDQSMRHCFRT